jgi:hypothetical protein
MTTEADIERYFVARVKSVGGTAYKFRSVNHRGVSDRIACMPNGEAWFVELKKPGGKLSPLQKMFADDMIRLWQRYCCLWSKSEVDVWLLRFS